MKEWSEANLAYLAGLIDGEGSIGMLKRTDGYRKNVGYRPHVNIKMVSEDLIRWLGETFGGNVYSIPLIGKDRQPQWEWHPKQSDLLVLLSAVRPYLRVKGPQADILIEYHLTNKPRDYKQTSPETLAMREDFWNRIGHLNAVGGRVRGRVHALTPM